MPLLEKRRLTTTKMRADSKMRKVQYRLCVKRGLDAAGYKYKALPENHEADFTVYPQDGGPAFNVRALGRCHLWAKKRNDNLHCAFCDPWNSDNCDIYMYPHDKLLALFEKGVGKNAHPKDWGPGFRSWRILHDTVRDVLIKHDFILRTPKE